MAAPAELLPIRDPGEIKFRPARPIRKGNLPAQVGGESPSGSLGAVDLLHERPLATITHLDERRAAKERQHTTQTAPDLSIIVIPPRPVHHETTFREKAPGWTQRLRNWHRLGEQRLGVESFTPDFSAPVPNVVTAIANRRAADLLIGIDRDGGQMTENHAGQTRRQIRDLAGQERVLEVLPTAVKFDAPGRPQSSATDAEKDTLTINALEHPIGPAETTTARLPQRVRNTAVHLPTDRKPGIFAGATVATLLADRGADEQTLNTHTPTEQVADQSHKGHRGPQGFLDRTITKAKEKVRSMRARLNGNK